MKKFFYIVIVVFIAVSFSSCRSGLSVKRANKHEVAGYTLKNKKEIMEQKILHKKNKSIIVIP